MSDEPIQERMSFAGEAPEPVPRFEGTGLGSLAAALAGRLRLRRPLVFLDLETTGLDPSTDRIVELSLARIAPGGGVSSLDSLIDPGVPIPAPASRVHGISDADVGGSPTFPELASRVARLLRGADVAGYNVERFDLPLLRAELDRAGVGGGWATCHVVDVCGIFKRMERRDLAAAYRFYCGGEPRAAHTAAGDVVSTIEVLIGQLDRYPQLPRTVQELDPYWRPPGRREPRESSRREAETEIDPRDADGVD